MSRVLIVGAGIGGLTAAVALRKLGAAVDLVDSAPEFRALGAGITLQPNASAVLAALGVELPPEAVVSIGQVEVLDAAGRPLVASEGVGADMPSPSYNIRRPDLHQALHDSLHDSLGVRLELGREVVGARELGEGEGEGVEVEFGDGQRGRWDLVIGADGIHSAVRRALHADRDPPLRYAGQTCWRFALDAPELVPDVTTERWSPGRRVGVVPLSRGGIYVYLVESAPAGTVGPGSSSVDALRTRFAPSDERLGSILDRVEADPQVHVHHGDLLDQPVISFGRGRIVLLGDAAHAMTPNMGQGGGMAIEDAAALGLAWAEVELDAIAATLAARRRARVELIHRRSWQIGQVAHWRGPVRCWLRDALIRATAGRAESAARDVWQPGIELAQELRATIAARSVTP